MRLKGYLGPIPPKGSSNDILITDTNDDDHLNNLHAILQTLEEPGRTLKQSKCKFDVPSVEYLEYIIDTDSLHPSKDKDTPWKWSQDQEKEYLRAKAKLHSSFVLTHYNKKPLVVACDASPNRLGAVLSHRMPDGIDLAVAYASHTLSAAEKCYSQLEKNALAIFFAVCHNIYGGQCVHSDHKPLELLQSESKQIPSSSIQHWAIALSVYNYATQ
uniref:Reverse transcriptase/retrotransposon-derived protein RNase H-like domain-containing protein n=1 Tax=Amphimedon queenslandica TaxID=400682 RepID=A0A1X7UUR8_AMPQE